MSYSHADASSSETKMQVTHKHTNASTATSRPNCKQGRTQRGDWGESDKNMAASDENNKLTTKEQQSAILGDPDGKGEGSNK